MNPLTIFAALLSVVPEAKAAMGVNGPCYALGCSNGDGLGQHKTVRPAPERPVRHEIRTLKLDIEGKDLL